MKTVFKSNNGLVWWLSALAGAKSLSSASVLSDVVDMRYAGLILAIVSALDVATAAYVAAAKPVGAGTP